MRHPKTRWLHGAGLTLALLVPTTWTLVSADVDLLRTDVEWLASDDLEGRVTATPGSEAARSYIMTRLFQAGYGGRVDTQDISDGDGGTNILAWLPGEGALANEYVLIGAHYDHVPFDDDRCIKDGGAADDDVCNGATDNATAVAVVLDIAEHFAQAPPSPRRGVYFLLWDREEDDLGGSVAYRNATLPPWPQPVAYINYDIQGANLLPSLRNTTLAIGASSGGARLASAVTNAAAPEGEQLKVRQLSEPLGFYRSDSATFLAPKVVNKENPSLPAWLPRVPTVFLTDSNGPCYHTPHDEPDIVDFPKLDGQARIGLRLLRDLVTGTKPTLQPLPDKAYEFGARVAFLMGWTYPYPPIPPPTYADAVALLDMMQTARCDAALPSEARGLLDQYMPPLQTVVTQGASAYKPIDDGTTVAVAAFYATLATQSGECDGFLEAGDSVCAP